MSAGAVVRRQTADQAGRDTAGKGQEGPIVKGRQGFSFSVFGKRVPVDYLAEGPTKSVNPSTILHEALHNLGKSDGQIQDAWKLPKDQGTDNITKKLIDSGCVKD